jgi:hypothetical protein
MIAGAASSTSIAGACTTTGAGAGFATATGAFLTTGVTFLLHDFFSAQPLNASKAAIATVLKITFFIIYSFCICL